MFSGTLVHSDAVEKELPQTRARKNEQIIQLCANCKAEGRILFLWMARCSKLLIPLLICCCV